MPRFDLPAAELVVYDPRTSAPADLDGFWERTLTETRQHPLGVERRPAESVLTAVESFDVSWRGYGGQRIRGWLHLPAAPGRQRLPGVVQFQGYGGGRGLVHEHVFWAAAGWAHLVVDTRGQGSGWTVGETPDPEGSGPAQPGFLTRGLADPHEYYYRRVFADAVRAVELMGTLEEVDPEAVAVVGGSQGGGISLAVAALCPQLAGVLCDVPFLCDFRRASELATEEPYLELVRYLAAHRDHEEQAFATLDHFDGAVLGRRARAPALFSVALMDQVCPPSTVYAAYNNYGGPKEIVSYPYNEHEGGQAFHQIRQVRWLRGVLERCGRA